MGSLFFTRVESLLVLGQVSIKLFFLFCIGFQSVLDSPRAVSGILGFIIDFLKVFEVLIGVFSPREVIDPIFYRLLSLLVLSDNLLDCPIVLFLLGFLSWSILMLILVFFFVISFLTSDFHLDCGLSWPFVLSI